MGNVTATEETWVPVRGFEGRYEVSDRGNVRGVDRVRKDGAKLKGKTLRARRKSTGHLTVCLYDERGVQTQLHIHRLVLLAFTPGPPQGKPLVLHRDDNPANNSLANLRWGDKRDNARDAVANGRHRSARVTHCPRGHELSGANLVPNKPRGGRECYCCAIARKRGRPYEADLILSDLQQGWRPARGRVIEPGTFRAEESPESL